MTRSVGVGSGALPRSLSDELISRPVVAAAVVSTGLLVAGEMDTLGAMHVLIGPAAGHSAAVCEGRVVGFARLRHCATLACPV